jgi:hypothetical protein
MVKPACIPEALSNSIVVYSHVGWLKIHPGCHSLAWLTDRLPQIFYSILRSINAFYSVSSGKTPDLHGSSLICLFKAGITAGNG